MGTIAIGVAIIVIAAAIIGARRWLAVERNRETLKQRFAERTCSHQWEPIHKPGEPVVIVTGDVEWCPKCGARR